MSRICASSAAATDNSSNIYIGRSLDLYGEYSHGEADVFEHLLRPGMVAIDVGATIGCHTLLIARLVRLEGAVITFESQRVVYQNLCANISLNALTNVHAVNSAVGSAVGSAAIPDIDYAAHGNFGGVMLTDDGDNRDNRDNGDNGDGKNGERVQIATIDSLPMEDCHLIKIDVEGMELDMLLGAAKQSLNIARRFTLKMIARINLRS